MRSPGPYVPAMGIARPLAVVHPTPSRGYAPDRYGEHTTLERIVNNPPAYHTPHEPPAIRESAGQGGGGHTKPGHPTPSDWKGQARLVSQARRPAGGGRRVSARLRLHAPSMR